MVSPAGSYDLTGDAWQRCHSSLGGWTIAHADAVEGRSDVREVGGFWLDRGQDHASSSALGLGGRPCRGGGANVESEKMNWNSGR